MGKDNVREILSLNVGQAGVQLGHTMWKQYTVEHGVKPGVPWCAEDQVRVKDPTQENITLTSGARVDIEKKAKTFFCNGHQ